MPAVSVLQHCGLHPCSRVCNRSSAPRSNPQRSTSGRASLFQFRRVLRPYLSHGHPASLASLAAHSNVDVETASQTRHSKSAMARMPKDDVQAHAASMGLDDQGLKPELIDRIIEAYKQADSPGMSATSSTTPAAQTQGPVPTAQEAETAPISRDAPQVTTAGVPSGMGGYDLQENDVMLTLERPAAHSNGDAEPASQARYSKSAMARMPKDEVQAHAASLGLDDQGLKPELIDSIIEAYRQADSPGISASTSKTAAAAASPQDAAQPAQEAAAPAQAKDAPAVTTAGAPPEMGGYDLKENETTVVAEGQQDDVTSKSTADLTFDDMMAMPKAELQQQCAAVGLPHSKRSKELLANQLLASMQAGVAAADPVDDSMVDLMKLTKAELQQLCRDADIPHNSRTTKQDLATELLTLQGSTAPSSSAQPMPTEDVATAGFRSTGQNAPAEGVMANSSATDGSADSNSGRRYKVTDSDATVKDVGIPGSEGAGQGVMPTRQRTAPLERDMDDQGPSAELGLYPPELDPTAPETAVADNALDTDTDVIAQQRRTDKQPIDLPNQEGEEEDVQELAMDDVLMLDQEPEPDFDLDDAQRPRLSRNADGDLTEANFGNDDETLSRLEDMGTSFAGKVGADMQRQQQGGAKRRRLASRTAYVPEDEDDEFGSSMTEARMSHSQAETPLVSDSPEEDSNGMGSQAYDEDVAADLDEPADQDSFFDEDDFAEGFKVSNLASDSLAMDEDDHDALLDGPGMTNQQYGKVREGVRQDLESARVRHSSAQASEVVENMHEEEEEPQSRPHIEPTPTPSLKPTPPVSDSSVPQTDSSSSSVSAASISAAAATATAAAAMSNAPRRGRPLGSKTSGKAAPKDIYQSPDTSSALQASGQMTDSTVSDESSTQLRPNHDESDDSDLKSAAAMKLDNGLTADQGLSETVGAQSGLPMPEWLTAKHNKTVRAAGPEKKAAAPTMKAMVFKPTKRRKSLTPATAVVDAPTQGTSSLDETSKWAIDPKDVNLEPSLTPESDNTADPAAATTAAADTHRTGVAAAALPSSEGASLQEATAPADAASSLAADASSLEATSEVETSDVAAQAEAVIEQIVAQADTDTQQQQAASEAGLEQLSSVTDANAGDLPELSSEAEAVLGVALSDEPQQGSVSSPASLPDPRMSAASSPSSSAATVASPEAAVGSSDYLADDLGLTPSPAASTGFSAIPSENIDSDQNLTTSTASNSAPLGAETLVQPSSSASMPLEAGDIAAPDIPLDSNLSGTANRVIEAGVEQALAGSTGFTTAADRLTDAEVEDAQPDDLAASLDDAAAAWNTSTPGQTPAADRLTDAEVEEAQPDDSATSLNDAAAAWNAPTPGQTPAATAADRLTDAEVEGAQPDDLTNSLDDAASAWNAATPGQMPVATVATDRLTDAEVENALPDDLANSLDDAAAAWNASAPGQTPAATAAAGQTPSADTSAAADLLTDAEVEGAQPDDLATSLDDAAAAWNALTPGQTPPPASDTQALTTDILVPADSVTDVEVDAQSQSTPSKAADDFGSGLNDAAAAWNAPTAGQTPVVAPSPTGNLSTADVNQPQPGTDSTPTDHDASFDSTALAETTDELSPSTDAEVEDIPTSLPQEQSADGTSSSLDDAAAAWNAPTPGQTPAAAVSQHSVGMSSSAASLRNADANQPLPGTANTITDYGASPDDDASAWTQAVFNPITDADVEDITAASNEAAGPASPIDFSLRSNDAAAAWSEAVSEAAGLADLGVTMPVTSSRPVSDELGDIDIAGADAHKGTDAELSSQSFADAVQEATTSFDAPAPEQKLELAVNEGPTDQPGHVEERLMSLTDRDRALTAAPEAASSELTDTKNEIPNDVPQFLQRALASFNRMEAAATALGYLTPEDAPESTAEAEAAALAAAEQEAAAAAAAASDAAQAVRVKAEAEAEAEAAVAAMAADEAADEAAAAAMLADLEAVVDAAPDVSPPDDNVLNFVEEEAPRFIDQRSLDEEWHKQAAGATAKTDQKADESSEEAAARILASGIPNEQAAEDIGNLLGQAVDGIETAAATPVAADNAASQAARADALDLASAEALEAVDKTVEKLWTTRIDVTETEAVKLANDIVYAEDAIQAMQDDDAGVQAAAAQEASARLEEAQSAITDAVLQRPPANATSTSSAQPDSALAYSSDSLHSELTPSGSQPEPNPLRSTDASQPARAEPIAPPVKDGPLPAVDLLSSSSMTQQTGASATPAAALDLDPTLPAANAPSSSSSAEEDDVRSTGQSLAPPPVLQQEIEADLADLQSLRAKVAEKQTALASMEAHLGSTNASAAQNRDQIQKLQLQMTELQDQHMAWQQSMLDGRLQELRAAAAKVQTNQALKAELQQQVEGMSSQLNSLEASLKASDQQMDSLQQELTSSQTDPDTALVKVQGRAINGSQPYNLPQGIYYEATDLPPDSALQGAQADTSPGEQSTSDRDQGQSPVVKGQNGVPQADPNAQDDSSASSPAAGPGVAMTFGVLKAAEISKATANFFSGLWGGKKKKPPSN